MTPDQINGAFEFIGGCFALLNVLRLLKDRQLCGVHWSPTLFFALWGMWNLYFYPSVNCWWSFTGGLLLVAVNATWVMLALYFRDGRR